MFNIALAAGFLVLHNAPLQAAFFLTKRLATGSKTQLSRVVHCNKTATRTMSNEKSGLSNVVCKSADGIAGVMGAVAGGLGGGVVGCLLASPVIIAGSFGSDKTLEAATVFAGACAVIGAVDCSLNWAHDMGGSRIGRKAWIIAAGTSLGLGALAKGMNELKKNKTKL